ncbi:uncharacterized protein [Malus domestica]|uniref:uncharacterized protein n=1 Tax=Malus domestica TaxID=3750 RepID=UPI003975033A
MSVTVPPTVSSSSPSTPSHQNSNNDENNIKKDNNNNKKPLMVHLDQQQSKIEPKRVKRILANWQSAQRSRVRRLQYILELECGVTTLQSEVSTLLPRVAFLDHQRLILNIDNSAIKQWIAALAQDKLLKDIHGRIYVVPRRSGFVHQHHWFRWMDCITTTPTWLEFTKALCREFEPSAFDDNAEALFKLRGLGGLKKELRYDVKLLKPANVHKAIAIAVQLDTKLIELKSVSSRNYTASKPFSTIVPPSSHTVPHTSNLAIKKLTPEEIQRKRARGECWFCYDKWVMGHKCGLKQLLMMDVMDSKVVEDNIEAGHPELQHMELSERAFYGTDGGSTTHTMKVLETTKAFQVMIADRGKVTSFGCCKAVELSLAGYHCLTYSYSLSLRSCDVVLRVQWLSTMSHVLWDFQLLTMEFTKDHQTYKLSHNSSDASIIQEVSLHQLDKELVNSNLGLLLYSMEEEKLESCYLNSVQLQELQQLLCKFEALFVLHTKLPPPRDHDHHIPLVQGDKPLNIRPYHYGPLQKTEIEKAVQELLEAGFIRPSHSPFSFPVLLVKKKEGTWRICIDYRELNALTIKDKYPIPLIDDLLDELHGSFYFYKLDLQSRYHQILMQPGDIEKTAFMTHE